MANFYKVKTNFYKGKTNYSKGKANSSKENSDFFLNKETSTNGKVHIL